jgi:hypothetical protein
MTEIKDINKAICGNYYKVCFEEPSTEMYITAYGEMQNFNPNKQVVIYNDLKGLYVISYSDIINMIPMPKPEDLSEYKRRKYYTV